MKKNMYNLIKNMKVRYLFVYYIFDNFEDI